MLAFENTPSWSGSTEDQKEESETGFPVFRGVTRSNFYINDSLVVELRLFSFQGVLSQTVRKLLFSKGQEPECDHTGLKYKILVTQTQGRLRISSPLSWLARLAS